VRFALIFPPQWDPRQPPLTLPALGAALASLRQECKAWDLNLDLYDTLLRGFEPGSIQDHVLAKYLDSAILGNYAEYGKISALIQRHLDETYDPSGRHSLFWDSWTTPFSPNKSLDWRKAVEGQAAFPFLSLIRKMIDEIANWQPEVICISAVSDTQLLPALALAGHFRRKSAHAKIHLGGDAFAYRRSILNKVPWLFETVDGICIADGEPTLQGIVAGLPPQSIPNMVWSDGTSVRFPEKIATHVFPTDVLPNFALQPTERYLSPKIVIPIETARGCPWGRCAFCIHPLATFNDKIHYNPKPLDAVVAELRHHIGNGYRLFFFVDEAMPPERLEELSSRILQLGEKISWICYSRLDRNHSRRVFSLAREAGCRKIFFGLETGSERILKTFRKGVTTAHAKQVLVDASNSDLGIHLFLMCGFPGENSEDRKATLDFLESILSERNAFSFTYDLFPLWCELDTELFLQPSEFGAQGIKIREDHDLAYQFKLLGGTINDSRHSQYLDEIDSLAAKCCKTKEGLRELHLSQDSSHLLLIEARS